MKLWIVGKRLAGDDAWEFGGVFDSEEKAIAACHANNYFIGPIELNWVPPHERLPKWEGAYFPRLEAKP
jgi:hypothetical protein